MVGFTFGSSAAAPTPGGAAAPALKKSVSFAPVTSSASTFGSTSQGLFSSTAPSFSAANNAGGKSSSIGASFGTTAANPAASASGFSFGASNNTASTPGAVFGSTAQTPNATTGLFGGAGGNGTTPSASGFGFNAASNKAAVGFGGTSNATTATSTGFGAVGNSFGGSTGGTTAASSFMQPTAATTGPTLDTPFDKLPLEFKNGIEQFGKYIKDQDKIELVVKSASGIAVSNLNSSIETLQADVVSLRNIENRQKSAIKAIKTDVKCLVQNGESAGSSLHCLKSGSTVQRELELPSVYFWQLIELFEKQMVQLNSHIVEVEKMLRPGKEMLQEVGARGPSSEIPSPQLVERIIREQNTSFMRIAGEVAHMHELANKLRNKYLALHGNEKDATGTRICLRNPFEAADRLEAEEARRADTKYGIPPGGGLQSSVPSISPGAKSGVFPTYGTLPTPTSCSPAAPLGGNTLNTGNILGAPVSNTPTLASFGATAPANSLFGSTPANGSKSRGSSAGSNSARRMKSKKK